MRMLLKLFVRPYRWAEFEKQHPFTALSVRFNRGWEAVRIFYLASVLLSYDLLPHVKALASSGTGVWLWPVAWIESMDPYTTPIILSIMLFASSVYTLFAFQYRHARTIFAVLVLFVTAVINSYGAINHPYHIWLWVSFLLILLPAHKENSLDRAQGRAARLSWLAVISGVQAYILLSYTLAGVHKVHGGLGAIVLGFDGNFSLYGFAHQIADRALQTNGSPFLADLVIDHPQLFAPAFWALIGLQTAALVFLFLPAFHRLLGLAFIGFHFGTWALMDIAFGTHVLWQAIFFVWSPFRPIYGRDTQISAVRRALAI